MTNPGPCSGGVLNEAEAVGGLRVRFNTIYIYMYIYLPISKFACAHI